jgi:hypothetical protein
MISLPSMQWGYIGSLNVLEYEATRWPTSSQGAALVGDSLDLSRPWEYLDRIYEEGSVVGWLTRTGQDGEALATLTDRLEN